MLTAPCGSPEPGVRSPEPLLAEPFSSVVGTEAEVGSGE